MIADSGMQQVVDVVIVSLPTSWENWIEFVAASVWSSTGHCESVSCSSPTLHVSIVKVQAF